MYKVLWRNENHPYHGSNAPHKVTYEMLKANWTYIADFGKWILAEALPKYDYAEEHLILWNKSTWWNRLMLCDVPSRSELRKILDSFTKKWYTTMINSQQDKSIPNQQHIHFIKLKQFSSKDLNLQ